MRAPKTPGPEKLTVLLDNISDTFYTLESAWRFIMLNQHATELLGSTSEELLGQICWEHFPEPMHSESNPDRSTQPPPK